MDNQGAFDLRRLFSRGNGYLMRKLETRPELLAQLTDFMSDQVVTNDPYSKYFSLPPWGNRSLWVGHGGVNGRRSLDREFGYLEEQELNAEWYKSVYGRWGIPARVVDIWPDECWAAKPQIYQREKPGDTEWDKKLDELWKKVMMDHYLWRIDRLSGICQFGVLFLGLNDKGRLDRPPSGINRDTGEPIDPQNPPKHELLYVRSFDQALVRVSSTDKNPRSARFGQPTYYSVMFYDAAISGSTSGVPDNQQKAIPLVNSRVHWTRMIHVADNRMTSEIYGIPRLRVVANLLHDLRKVSGGSAEMFFKGGFPGLAFETYPDLAGMGAEADIDSMREQINLYQEGTQRFLFSVGGSWKSLPPNIANPDGNLSWIVKLICCAINVPARIFMGSEAGHLASTKDDDAWRTRCSQRQTDYLEPRLLRPVVDRLQNLGCIKRTDKYNVSWRDLRAMADKDRADISLKRTQAIVQYATGGGPLAMPMKVWLTEVMGFSQEHADVIIAEQKKSPPPSWAMPQLTGPQGGSGAGRTGKAPRGQTGRPSGQKPGQNNKGSGRPSSSSRGRTAINNSLKVRR